MLTPDQPGEDLDAVRAGDPDLLEIGHVKSRRLRLVALHLIDVEHAILPEVEHPHHCELIQDETAS